MNYRRAALLVALAIASVPTGHAQVRTASKTRAHVEMLASPQFGGRLTGSPGERLASDYIASQLKKMGARPLPGQADYLMPFDFTAGTRDGGTTVRIDSVPPRMSNKTYSGNTDVQALSFSDNADVTAPVVFAGYGIVVPESQNFGYDSYAMLDVKDKIVLVLRVLPGRRGPEDTGDSLSLLRPALQGDGGSSARRQGHAGRHRPELTERR